MDGGGSWCFAGIVVVFQLFFFFVWVMALWVMLAGSNGKSMEEWRRFVKQNREMEEMREIFFFLNIYICIYLCSLYYFNKLYEKLETVIYS